MSVLSLPGVIDAHVHLREPGATQKEDIYSGTVAALAGGVIGVLDMPNNAPPIVDERTLLNKEKLFETKAVTDYGLFLGYGGGDVSFLIALSGRVVGLKLYLDETFGNMTMRAPEELLRVFEAWPGPGPIAIHAGSRSIDVALRLADRYKQQLHVCHVPHPKDLIDIDKARQHGVRVTCEVTPHHLFLSAEDGARLGPYGSMKPPLVSPSEVALFWQRLDLVDVIATDHAPHTRAEKDSANPPPGIPGLETMLPLLLGAVDEGRLTLERMVDLIHHNPLRIYHLSPPSDSGIEVLMGEPYQLPKDGYRTRCGWSPFVGKRACGRVACVRLRGEIAWSDGEVMVAPGYGQPLLRSV